MIPYEVPVLFVPPMVNVAGPAVLVTVPRLLNCPVAVPGDTPLRSSIPPCRMVSVAFAAARRLPVPESLTVPSLIVTVPVLALAVEVSVRVPAPDFVQPPVKLEVMGELMVSESPEPFTRMIKAPDPPVVIPVPPLMEDAPPVAKIPPSEFAVPVRIVRV